MESELSRHQNPADLSLCWPFFQPRASIVPIPRQIIGVESRPGVRGAVSTVDIQGEDDEDDASDGVFYDDYQELFSAGRKRHKRLPSLKIGDMVVSMSPDDILWFGRLVDTKYERTPDSEDPSKEKSEQLMLIHWWDHDRSDLEAKKTYRPHWSRSSKRSSSGKRRRTNECTEKYSFSKPNSRNGWKPNQDWVHATSLLYWVPFGRLVNKKGELYDRTVKKLKIRVSLYDKTFKL